MRAVLWSLVGAGLFGAGYAVSTPRATPVSVPQPLTPEAVYVAPLPTVEVIAPQPAMKADPNYGYIQAHFGLDKPISEQAKEEKPIPELDGIGKLRAVEVLNVNR